MAQAVAFRSTFPTPGPLISIAAALLDLQHDHPPLLAAAAAAAAAAEDPAGELQVEEVISLLLAVGFFRVAAPDFTTQALQVGCEDGWLVVTCWWCQGGQGANSRTGFSSSASVGSVWCVATQLCRHRRHTDTTACCLLLLLQTLGEAGEQLCELDGVQVSRLWRALLLLRDDGVELPQELLQVCLCERGFPSKGVQAWVMFGCCSSVLTRRVGSTVRAWR
jgi:hypothetical protein